MLELGLTVESAFWWGMVAATVGWLVLAFVSATVLGLMIRRSDQAMDAEARHLAAQQEEILEAARAASEAAKAEVPPASTEVPSESGTRYRPVVTGPIPTAPDLPKTRRSG